MEDDPGDSRALHGVNTVTVRKVLSAMEPTGLVDVPQMNPIVVPKAKALEVLAGCCRHGCNITVGKRPNVRRRMVVRGWGGGKKKEPEAHRDRAHTVPFCKWAKADRADKSDLAGKAFHNDWLRPKDLKHPGHLELQLLQEGG
jgi:hypothetical protein